MLRLAPGIEVARIDANHWAVTSRGFNGQFANKLLVLVDGREVYSPLFSGVYWDVQDTLLDDIDRIEVIRGPGGALWGANAVNGVINIMMKPAAATQGGLVTVGIGSVERGASNARYGGTLGSSGHYRFIAKHVASDGFSDASGQPAADDRDVTRGGFRIDWNRSSDNTLTIQGDLYRGDAGFRRIAGGTAIDERVAFSGENISATWTRSSSQSTSTTLQTYYDRSTRDDPALGEHRYTFSLDFQRRQAMTRRHDVVWGLAYRFSRDQIRNSPVVSFRPDSFDWHLYTAFVQDEIELVTDRLYFTPGAKVEHNGFTGVEFQPSVRGVWIPTPQQTVWAAASRTVRTPSRSSRHIRITIAALPGPPGRPSLLTILGNPDTGSEVLVAAEFGYRLQVSPRLSLDATLFRNQYHNLTTVEPGAPFVDTFSSLPSLIVPLRFDNQMHGQTTGAEVAANWRVTDRWTLSGAYSALRLSLRIDPSSRDFTRAADTAGSSPARQLRVSSYLNLPLDLQLDTQLYYTDRLVALQIPAYTRLDTRLGWRPTAALDLSVVLRNLLDDRHREFVSSDGTEATQVRRSAIGQIRWWF